MKNYTRNTLAGTFISAFLVACGGGSSGESGGSSSGTPGTTLPPTTTATITRTGLSGCVAKQLEGTATDQGLAIARVSLLQVVEQLPEATETVLAGGKGVVVRLDITAPKSGVVMPKAKLLIGHDGEVACTEIAFSSASGTAPVAVDRQTMASSLKAVIPAAEIREGLTYMILVDGETPSTKTAADRLFRVGKLNVTDALEEEVIIMPLTFQGETGSAASEADIKSLMSRTLPVSDITVTKNADISLAALKVSDATLTDGVYYFPESKLNDALVELNNQCLSLIGTGLPTQSAPHCVGVWPSNIVFGTPSNRTLGKAFTGGYSMMVASFTTTDDPGATGPYGSHWLTQGALNFLHEYGHVLGLHHAACGVTGIVDAGLYADGRLGDRAGYDAGREFYFLGSASNGFADIMSYCGKGWHSDKGYRKIIDYKLNGIPVTDGPTG